MYIMQSYISIRKPVVFAEGENMSASKVNSDHCNDIWQ